MEAHLVSHVSEHLISSLNFKPSSGTSSYVTAFRFVTFQAESGDLWSTSNRTIRFRLASSDFLDLESVRLHRTVHNTTTVTGSGPPLTGAVLTPILPGAMGLFQRARLYMSGALVEDIDEIGTHTALLERLKSSARKYNDAQESGHAYRGGATADAFNIDDETLQHIPAGAAKPS